MKEPWRPAPAANRPAPARVDACAAQRMRAGAVVVTDDTREPVTYAHDGTGPGRFRPWITAAGDRYDSRDVHPEW
ncbi:hypothetical protein [Streptomyces sp. NPDC090021]|uniref:hypothetical protein n=1 Tax=Streptomyces sp. NPDC090021 TaxID=3365919 RepID=UPI00382FC795